MKVEIAKNVDEYIKEAPQETQSLLREIRKTIREALPDAEESISYRMPAYRIGKGYPVVFFAAFKGHISLFLPKLNKHPELRKGLEKFYVKGATIHFPIDKPVPLALIKKIVKKISREK